MYHGMKKAVQMVAVTMIHHHATYQMEWLSNTCPYKNRRVSPEVLNSLSRSNAGSAMSVSVYWRMALPERGEEAQLNALWWIGSGWAGTSASGLACAAAVPSCWWLWLWEEPGERVRPWREPCLLRSTARRGGLRASCCRARPSERAASRKCRPPLPLRRVGSVGSCPEAGWEGTSDQRSRGFGAMGLRACQGRGLPRTGSSSPPSACVRAPPSEKLARPSPAPSDTALEWRASRKLVGLCFEDPFVGDVLVRDIRVREALLRLLMGRDGSPRSTTMRDFWRRAWERRGDSSSASSLAREPLLVGLVDTEWWPVEEVLAIGAAGSSAPAMALPRDDSATARPQEEYSSLLG
mmetsp:Transcript_6133/g.17116  ORF Transcript_6133/g.17116 Transcript_6133/m.17116 type:complete len:351 (+) Transcript_6133:3146-4198(+)